MGRFNCEEKMTHNHHKIKVVTYYVWIVAIGLTLFSFFSFIKINKINYNIMPIIIAVLITISMKYKKILAYQLVGIVSFFSFLFTLSAFIPFEGHETPVGINLVLLLIVATILIIMSALCLEICKTID
jgi:hypothetical protein